MLKKFIKSLVDICRPGVDDSSCIWGGKNDHQPIKTKDPNGPVGVSATNKDDLMKIGLKCFDTLVKPEACDFNESSYYELKSGQTLGHLIRLAGIDSDEIKIAFVNNRLADFDTVLCDGDRVGLAPTFASLNDPHSCINNAASVNCGDW